MPRFLTLCHWDLGPDALKKLRAFTFPAEIKDTTYAALRKTLVDRLSPKTNIVAQQQKFMNLNQIAGESLCTFMSRLKEAANVCQFGALFDTMVRTRFVAGLSSDRIRAELISESADNDTSASVFEKAQTKENALQSSLSVTTHYVQKPGKFSKPQNSKFQQKADLSIVCSRCTVRGHVAKNCKVRCRNCRKPGHIAKNCRSAKKQSHCVEGIGDDGNASAADYGYTHQESENTLYCVETTDPVQIPVQTPVQIPVQIPVQTLVPEGTVPASVVSNLSSCIDCNQKPFLKVKINDKILKMELDTGSSLSCISKSDFARLGLTDCQIVPCSQKLRVANFNCESIDCKALVNVEFRGKSWILPLYVVDSRFPTLLGREWIIQMFGKDWLDHMVGLVDVEQSHAVSKLQRDEFVNEILHSPVFDPGVGTPVA